MTMGDMKTPDFDDLLAAFDIPDMVDPKAAIESGHDDHESHMKQNAHGEDDSHAPSSSDVGVSVIVKNVRTLTLRGRGERRPQPTGNGLHNGFLTASSLDSYSKDGAKSLERRCDAERLDIQPIEVDDPPDQEDVRSSFRSNQDYDKLKALGGENSAKLDSLRQAMWRKQSFYEPFKVRKAEDKLKESSDKVLENRVLDGSRAPRRMTPASPPLRHQRQSRLTLSSCIASIAALQLLQRTSESHRRDQKTILKQPDSPRTFNQDPVLSSRSTQQSPKSRTVTRVLPEVILTLERNLRADSVRDGLCDIPSVVSSISRRPFLPPGRLSVCGRDQCSSPAELTPKQVTIKPVATAFLPVSAVKTQDPNASSAIIKAANAIQQQTVVVPASSLANAKLVPKTVHLANLNLLPQGAQATSELRQVLTKPQQQIKQAIINAAASQPPKKVSRVQVVSSLQSSVVEAFNKVLSSVNPVPVYIPNLSPPANAGITLPTRGYKCLECGDSFALEKSLTQHYDRRSVRIEVTCNHSLLLHRGIRRKGGNAMLHLILKPVPADQMIVSPSSNTSLSTSTLQTLWELAHTLSQKFIISRSFKHSITPAMPLDEDPSNYITGYTFQQAADTSGQKTCTICRCCFLTSAVMHHTRESISRCTSSPRHQDCLHYTRRVGFRCVHCNVVSHCEVFYKCLFVQWRLMSPSTHSHAYTQHPVFHVRHCVHPKVSVFKCPDCSLYIIEGPPNLGINLPLSIKPATQNSANQNKEDTKSMNGKEKLEKKSPSPVKKSMETKKVASPGWTCWECDCLFMQRDVYISHVRKEHGKQMKKHPCRQCDKSFSSSHSLCRHNRIKHKGIRKVYACSHCPDSRRTFTKRLMLEKHVQLMHGIKDPDLKEMTDATNEEETEIKEDTKVPSPRRKLEEPVLEFRPPRGAITQPLKKLKINVFKVHKCAVCGFTTENLLQFHEHIPQHKSDGSSYQCRECGLCYTSHVSLSRHLFIVHKLKEPQPVSKQNGAGEDNQQENKPSHEDESPDGAVSDRKCKVCAKTFETEAALNTHMRTHGMAFIKSKRMSSAEK
uniref:Zinc finger protein 532 n=1 Tax=Pan troglodytes TaxID=9598 RepID=A0A2I3SPY8_PANTR